MDPSAIQSQHAMGKEVLWNLSRMTADPRRLLQVDEKEGNMVLFREYSPPPRDAITMPRHMLYVLVGVVLVVLATYAIVGHLIKDLFHDLADWLLGPQKDEDDECSPCTEEEEQEGEAWVTDTCGEEIKIEEGSPRAQSDGSILLLPGHVSAQHLA